MKAGHHTSSLDDQRLRWLAEVSTDADVSEVLSAAIVHAVAGVGALGGLIHLAGPEEGTLNLAASSSIPSRLTQAWGFLDGNALDLAPARAVKDSRVVWSQAHPPEPRAAVGRTPKGMLSAPIIVGGIPIGALSIMTDVEPPEGRSRYLLDVAAVVGARLAAARRWRSGAGPWHEPLSTEQQAARKVTAGAWSWELASGLLAISEAAEPLLAKAGLDPRTWDRHIETWLNRIHPGDRDAVEQEIARAQMEDDPYAVEYRVVDGGGRESWLLVCGWFVYNDAGAPVRTEGIAWDATRQRSQEAWLAGLWASHPLPTYVLDADNRVVWGNAAARALALRENAARELASQEAIEVTNQVPWETMPDLKDQGVPQLIAAARATPGHPETVAITSWEHARGADAYYEITAVGIGDYVSVTTSDVTERAEAAAAAEARERSIADLNAALIRALDTSDVVAAITEHVLPLVDADGLVIHDMSGTSARLVGDAGYPAEFVAGLKNLGWPIANFVDHNHFIESREELVRRWPELAHINEIGGKAAWAMLPLNSGDRRVGSCVISWSKPRTFTDEDKSLLGTLAVFIAQALGNARLYEEAHDRAERLQKELLPGALPDLVAIQTAARWRAAAGRDVGGDWYDTIRLPSGRTLAVIGDVLGHGLEQSIAMGIIRHTVITVAQLDLPLDELIARVGDVAARIGGPSADPAPYATCLMMLYDPATGTCNIASAGHPAPILLEPDRDPTVLDVPTGPPLGLAQVVDPIPVQVTQRVVPAGTTHVLFTNGVLGSSNDATDLASAVARYTAATPPPTTCDERGEWLAALCASITTELPPDPRHQDDAALLALTTHRLPTSDVVTRSLPCASESAAQARKFVAGQLAIWQLDDLIDSAALIVSELVGNTTRHAVGVGVDATSDDTGIIYLRLLHIGDAVTCEVHDGSEATPRVRHPTLDDEFGRGLQLVAYMAANWGTRYTEHGKCIWASVTRNNSHALTSQQP